MYSPPDMSDINIAVRYQTENFITSTLHYEFNNINFLWKVYQQIINDCENNKLVVKYYEGKFFTGDEDDFIEEYYNEETGSVRIEKLTRDYTYLQLFRFYPIVLVPNIDIDKWTCYINHSRDSDPIMKDDISIRIPIKLIIPIIYKCIADIYYMYKCNMSELVDNGVIIMVPEFYLNRPSDRFLFHQDSGRDFEDDEIIGTKLDSFSLLYLPENLKTIMRSASITPVEYLQYNVLYGKEVKIKTQHLDDIQIVSVPVTGGTSVVLSDNNIWHSTPKKTIPKRERIHEELLNDQIRTKNFIEVPVSVNLNLTEPNLQFIEDRFPRIRTFMRLSYYTYTTDNSIINPYYNSKIFGIPLLNLYTNRGSTFPIPPPSEYLEMIRIKYGINGASSSTIVELRNDAFGIKKHTKIHKRNTQKNNKINNIKL